MGEKKRKSSQFCKLLFLTRHWAEMGSTDLRASSCAMSASQWPDRFLCPRLPGEYPHQVRTFIILRGHSSLSPCGHLHWWPMSHGGYAVGILAWIKVLVGATVFPSTYLQGNRRPASLGNTPDETVQVSVLLNLNSQLHFSTFCNGVGSVRELPWRTLSERRLKEKLCGGWLGHFTRSSLVMGKRDIETMATGICRCFLQNKQLSHFKENNLLCLPAVIKLVLSREC